MMRMYVLMFKIQQAYYSMYDVSVEEVIYRKCNIPARLLGQSNQSLTPPRYQLTNTINLEI